MTRQPGFTARSPRIHNQTRKSHKIKIKRPMGGWFLPRRRNSQFFGQFTIFRTAFMPKRASKRCERSKRCKGCQFSCKNQTKLLKIRHVITASKRLFRIAMIGLFSHHFSKKSKKEAVICFELHGRKFLCSSFFLACIHTLLSRRSPSETSCQILLCSSTLRNILILHHQNILRACFVSENSQ